MRDQSPRPERRHCDDGGPIQPVWSSDLTPRPEWRPAPVASRHPSFERTCHVVTDPAGKGHVATGAEPIQTLSDALGADGADALAAAASTLPSASGISSGSPFPASANGSCTHRCPRPRLGSRRSARLVPYATRPTSRPASDRPAPMVRTISPVDPCSVAKATSARRGGKLDGDAVSMAPQRGIRTTSGRLNGPRSRAVGLGLTT